MKKIDISHFSSGLVVPVLIIAGILFGYLALYPQYKQIKDSKSELAAKETAAADKKSSVNSIKNLVAQLNDKRAQLAPVEESLPLSPDIPELLANLEFLGRQSGMVVENIQVAPLQDVLGPDGKVRESSDKLGMIRADMTVNGRYPQLLAFILNMETNLRLLDVQSINFGAASSESQNQSYVLEMITYYQKP